MARHDIAERLRGGDRLLLDGGTGSELERRGVFISQRTAEGGMGAWSATAIVDAPEVVEKIHEDYLRAGADIVTTNTFWCNRTRLGLIGQADRMEEYNRIGVRLAVDARDAVSPDAFVAGSMAPPVGRPTPHNIVRSDDIAGESNDQAAVLADAGADLNLLEYVSSVEEAVSLVDAADRTGLSVLLGLKHFGGDGVTREGESVEQLIEAVQNKNVAAVLDMCSPPQEISNVLPRVITAFDGPTGAYANIGYINQDVAAIDDTSDSWHRIDWGENTPERHTDVGRAWLDMGAQIIGGCCATGPKHIAALKPLVRPDSSPVS